MLSDERRRVLVVEDDPDQFDALAMALDSAGYEVEHARDGKEALAVLGRFQPHVVVTDLVMPEMSGDELIRLIKAREGPRPGVVVVSGLDSLEAHCEALGSDACLGKPIDLDRLLETVARASDRASERAAAAGG